MSTTPVEIVGVQLNPVGTSVVVLRAANHAERLLPILIGPAEATSIAIAMAEIDVPRPGTHDLLLTVLERIGARLERVTITELVEGTFHAELSVDAPRGRRRIDARPSDALALAVRTGVPIRVDPAVLTQAGVEVARDRDEPMTDAEIDEVTDRFRELLASATPEDFEDPDDADDG